METVLGFVKDFALSGWGTTVFFGVITALVGKKYHKFLKEIKDVVKAHTKATSKNSPGGEEYTQEELAAIGKEIVDVVQEGAKIAPGIIKRFKKK